MPAPPCCTCTCGAADGSHSLEAADYRPAVAAVRAAVGDALVLQLTTEAVGVYAPPQQMAVIRELQPEAASLALRELVPDAAHEAAAADFFGWLWRARVAVQYILYSCRGRRALLRTAPTRHHPGRAPLGAVRTWRRYTQGQRSAPADLLPFLQAWQQDAALTQAVPWAMCAFGAREADCAMAAALMGGHARIGFENNMLLPDGRNARDNAELVATFAGAAATLGFTLADADALRALCVA